MSILKNKVAHARRCRELEAQKTKVESLKDASSTHSQEEDYSQFSVIDQTSKKNALNNLPARKPPSSNNIMKNYSRALTNFTLSKVAQPYVESSLETHGIARAYFYRFIKKDKQKMNCIQSLRNKLLIYPSDVENVARCKRVFQAVCEVFLKYFSVNWIFSSKVNDRLMHLKYRFKILRRVRNPEHFTYLKEFKKKNQECRDETNL